jgi:hypothetical protein
MSTLLDAIARIKDGDLEAAARICEDVLRAGEHADAYGLLAEISWRRRDFAATRRYAERAVALAPESADYQNLLGLGALNDGLLDEAIASLDKAIDLQLDHEPAHVALCTALQRRARPEGRYLVSVITPTRGTAQLRRAIESVQAQTYPRIEHLIVADGPVEDVPARLALPEAPRHLCHLIQLPYRTGAGRFNGHRIYGAMGYLANGRYVCLLDEDNWFEPDHVASLMALVECQDLQWAYALRNIVDAEGRLVARDDCESLGRWPVWHNPSAHLVDMNCYLLRRDLLVKFSPIFYRRAYEGPAPDALICRLLLDNAPRLDTSGAYTVNYTAGSNPRSVTADFFLRDNEVMRAKYPAAFPWRKPPGGAASAASA